MKTAFNLLAAIAIGFVVWVIICADANQPTIFQVYATSLPYGDKLGHFGLFFSLAMLLNFTYQLKRINLVHLNIYTGSAYVFSFATIEEFSQLMFAPQRTFDLIDLLADVCGILVAHFLTQFITVRKASN